MRLWKFKRAALSVLMLAAAVVASPHAAASEGENFDYVQPNGPNYTWTDDLSSQVMAGHPGPVLHRVDGSWFNAPDVPAESIADERQAHSLYGPGTPIYVGGSKFCTLAVAGYDNQGHKVGITAGHCASVGDPVMSADSWGMGATGTVVRVNPQLDYALIEFGPNADVTRTYNGVTINALGGGIGTGQTVCKQGVATGYTCGVSWSDAGVSNISQVCAMQGDSGAPLMAGDRFVGLVTGGLLPIAETACHTPLQGPIHTPTRALIGDLILGDINATGGVGAGFYLP